MKPTFTIALAAITLLIGGFVVFWEHEMATTDELAQREGTLVHFDPNAVAGVEIQRQTETVRAERDRRTGEWAIVSPVKDRGYPAAMAALVNAAAALKIRAEIDAADIAESRSGLGRTADVLRLLGSDGDELAAITVGAASAFADCRYVRLGSGDPIIAEGELWRWLENPAQALRDRRLTALRPEAIARLRIATALGEIEISREAQNALWRMEKPLKTRADQQGIDALIADLTAARATPSGGKGAAEISADTMPERLWVWGFGSQDPVEIAFHRPSGEADPGPVRVTLSDRPDTAFTLDSKLPAFLSVKPNALRQKVLANIDARSVYGIFIESRGGAPVVLKRAPNGPWRLERRPGVLEYADVGRIAKFIDGLNREVILDYAADSAPSLKPFGLDPPYFRIRMLNDVALQALSDGKPLDGENKPEGAHVLDLMVGEGEKPGHLFAKYSDEPFVYEISPAALQLFEGNPAEWRSVDITAMAFDEFSLRRIAISTQGSPPLDLRFSPGQLTSASLAGQDVMPLIDEVRLAELKQNLSAIVARGWIEPSGEILTKLQTPALEITLEKELTDEDLSPAGVEKTRLTLAPTGTLEASDLFFGRIDSSPDVFLLSRHDFQLLSRPVLNRR